VQLAHLGVIQKDDRNFGQADGDQSGPAGQKAFELRKRRGPRFPVTIFQAYLRLSDS
jgi:hypothetical protein